jgi:choline-phosphate cytidylyltransferase
MVGVCAGSLVRQHKASPVLTSAERYESVRHCKWVDEVVENAPWVIDGAFLEKWGIDYVAHDEEPYQSSGVDDVYNYVKSIGSSSFLIISSYYLVHLECLSDGGHDNVITGAFLPTKRTNGVSTSELLQRIVEGYREGFVVSALPSFP